MLFSSAFATIMGLVTMITTGEIFEASQYIFDTPSVLTYCVLSAIMGYLSVGMVLLLIKHFGATIAEVVKSCRKVVSICLSFLLYTKPISFNHVIGGLLFTMSISIGIFLPNTTRPMLCAIHV